MASSFKFVSKRAKKEQEKLEKQGYLLVDIESNHYNSINPSNITNNNDNNNVSAYHKYLRNNEKAMLTLTLLRGLLEEENKLAFVTKIKDEFTTTCLESLLYVMNLESTTNQT